VKIKIMVTTTIQPPPAAAAATSSIIIEPPTMSEEQLSSQSPSQERSSKRLRLSRLENPVKGDVDEVDVVLARTSPSVSPQKLYHCPACDAKNMSGDKLKEHFLAEHKDLMTAVNKSATGANDSTENKSMGTWSETECQTFEAGCIIFGWGKWASITTLISTRDKAQIKSHAQKFMIHRNDEYKELIAYHNGDDLSDNSSTKSNVSSGNDSATSSNAGSSPSWTVEEQEQFKMGVIINGWGSWKEIAKNVPTKNIAQIRSRALNIKRHKQDEETKLKAEHAKLVSRNPQLYGSDYVSRVTGEATADNDEPAVAVKPKSQKIPKSPKSPKSSSSSQSSVRSTNNESGYAEGLWTPDEHNKFEQAVITYGWGDWVNVTAQIPTRDKNQVKSHAQKFDLHHPGGKDRLVGEHLRNKRKKAVDAKQKVEKKKKAEKVKKQIEVVEDGQMESGEGKTADVTTEVRENADVTFEESDKMEVEQHDDTTNYQEKQRVQEEESTEEDRKEDEKEEDAEASTISSEESRQQLRVSPRVVKAPRDNYIDSLQKEQWQRKKKVSRGQAPNDVGGVRQRSDGSYEVRISYARKWCKIGVFDSKALAQVAHRIASDILQPEATPSDPAAVEWNIKIARDAAVDGAKLAERDAEGGGEGGLLEPPKAIQNYLLGGHMVSAGEQTIKHRLFATSTAAKTETNLAHFTVTCSNGAYHVDVGINDSLFDLRRKIFDQFDSSQLDDGNCNFNFQVDTNMVSRKVEGSFIARDLLQLGKSVELIPRSAVLTGESSQEVVPPENGATNLYLAGEEDDDEEEDLTSFYEAAGSTMSSRLMNLANEIATVTPTGSGANHAHPPKVVDFLHFLKESPTLVCNIDYSHLTELEYIYMMEKTGLHEKQVDKWISDAKNRFMKSKKSTQPDAQTDTLKVDTLDLASKAL